VFVSTLTSKAGVVGISREQISVALVVGCCLISSEKTMQIGLAAAATKVAFVNRRTRLQTCRERVTLAGVTARPPAEYKQACNFMGPLWVPTAEPENHVLLPALAVVRGEAGISLARSVRAFLVLRSSRLDLIFISERAAPAGANTVTQKRPV